MPDAPAEVPDPHTKPELQPGIEPTNPVPYEEPEEIPGTQPEMPEIEPDVPTPDGPPDLR